MILIDGNLILRAIEHKDAELLREMVNDPKIEKMVLGWSLPVSEHKQLEWVNKLKSDDMKYIIEVAGEAIGMSSITNLDFKNSTATINIKIKGEQNKGKGIGSKTIRLLIKYCFEELNLNSLMANILEYNTSSYKMFEKFGFKRDGILRSRIYKNGKYHNVLSYSLLRNEYKL